MLYNIVILQLNGTFRQELVPYGFSLVVLYTYQSFLSTCGAFSEVVFEVEKKSNLFLFIEGQTHFSTS